MAMAGIRRDGTQDSRIAAGGENCEFGEGEGEVGPVDRLARLRRRLNRAKTRGGEADVADAQPGGAA
jgi:hypothetical protein